MSTTNCESSYAKDIVASSRKSKVEVESSSSDESSMPIIGMKIGTITHFEELTCFLELSEEDYEIACESTDLTYSCVNYLRWRHQDVKALHIMNDFVDEEDFCGDFENDFEGFSDSDEDDESDCCDDLQDSIRLTRSRFCKERATEVSQNYKVTKNCRIE